MKTSVAIGFIIATVLIVWGVWLFISSNKTSSVMTSSGSATSMPIASPAGTTNVQTQQPSTPPVPVVVQQISSPQNPTVAHDFLSQIENSNEITLGGTVVASPYALQIWGDENKGGEALLKYTTPAGWTLISLGGGEWTVEGLVQVGVQTTYAEQLVAGLKR